VEHEQGKVSGIGTNIKDGAHCEVMGGRLSEGQKKKSFVYWWGKRSLSKVIGGARRWKGVESHGACRKRVGFKKRAKLFMMPKRKKLVKGGGAPDRP